MGSGRSNLSTINATINQSVLHNALLSIQWTNSYAGGNNFCHINVIIDTIIEHPILADYKDLQGDSSSMVVK